MGGVTKSATRLLRNAVLRDTGEIVFERKILRQVLKEWGVEVDNVLADWWRRNVHLGSATRRTAAHEADVLLLRALTELQNNAAERAANALRQTLDNFTASGEEQVIDLIRNDVTFQQTALNRIDQATNEGRLAHGMLEEMFAGEADNFVVRMFAHAAAQPAVDFTAFRAIADDTILLAPMPTRLAREEIARITAAAERSFDDMAHALETWRRIRQDISNGVDHDFLSTPQEMLLRLDDAHRLHLNLDGVTPEEQLRRLAQAERRAKKLGFNNTDEALQEAERLGIWDPNLHPEDPARNIAGNNALGQLDELYQRAQFLGVDRRDIKDRLDTAEILGITRGSPANILDRLMNLRTRVERLNPPASMGGVDGFLKHYYRNHNFTEEQFGLLCRMAGNDCSQLMSIVTHLRESGMKTLKDVEYMARYFFEGVNEADGFATRGTAWKEFDAFRGHFNNDREAFDKFLIDNGFSNLGDLETLRVLFPKSKKVEEEFQEFVKEQAIPDMGGFFRSMRENQHIPEISSRVDHVVETLQDFRKKEYDKAIERTLSHQGNWRKGQTLIEDMRKALIGPGGRLDQLLEIDPKYHFQIEETREFLQDFFSYRNNDGTWNENLIARYTRSNDNKHGVDLLPGKTYADHCKAMDELARYIYHVYTSDSLTKGGTEGWMGNMTMLFNHKSGDNKSLNCFIRARFPRADAYAPLSSRLGISHEPESPHLLRGAFGAVGVHSIEAYVISPEVLAQLAGTRSIQSAGVYIWDSFFFALNDQMNIWRRMQYALLKSRHPSFAGRWGGPDAAGPASITGIDNILLTSGSGIRVLLMEGQSAMKYEPLQRILAANGGKIPAFLKPVTDAEQAASDRRLWNDMRRWWQITSRAMTGNWLPGNIDDKWFINWDIKVFWRAGKPDPYLHIPTGIIQPRVVGRVAVAGSTWLTIGNLLEPDNENYESPAWHYSFSGERIWWKDAPSAGIVWDNSIDYVVHKVKGTKLPEEDTPSLAQLGGFGASLVNTGARSVQKAGTFLLPFVPHTWVGIGKSSASSESNTPAAAEESKEEKEARKNLEAAASARQKKFEEWRGNENWEGGHFSPLKEGERFDKNKGTMAVYMRGDANRRYDGDPALFAAEEGEHDKPFVDGSATTISLIWKSNDGTVRLRPASMGREGMTVIEIATNIEELSYISKDDKGWSTSMATGAQGKVRPHIDALVKLLKFDANETSSVIEGEKSDKDGVSNVLTHLKDVLSGKKPGGEDVIEVKMKELWGWIDNHTDGEEIKVRQAVVLSLVPTVLSAEWGREGDTSENAQYILQYLKDIVLKGDGADKESLRAVVEALEGKDIRRASTQDVNGLATAIAAVDVADGTIKELASSLASGLREVGMPEWPGRVNVNEVILELNKKLHNKAPGSGDWKEVLKNFEASHSVKLKHVAKLDESGERFEEILIVLAETEQEKPSASNVGMRLPLPGGVRPPSFIGMGS